MFSRQFLIAQAVIIVAATTLAFLYVNMLHRKPVPLPVYGAIADFSLTDQNGKPAGLNGLKGKIWVADFMFTSCKTICPMLTKNMGALYKEHAGDNDLRFVSITVDPGTDTPAVLKAYAAKHEATSGQWLFLSGPSDLIKQLAVKSFMIGGVEDILMHSGLFTLVDRKGHIRGYYEGTDPEAMGKLREAIKALKKE